MLAMLFYLLCVIKKVGVYPGVQGFSMNSRCEPWKIMVFEIKMKLWHHKTLQVNN